MAEERDDVEVAWARIVADYDLEVDDAVRPWPHQEDVAAAPDDEATADRTGTEPPARNVGPDPVEADLLGRPDEAMAADLDRWDSGKDTGRDNDKDTEHHYVPPVPPPLGRPDLPNGLAWAGVLGGPLVLLLATVLAWDMPRLLTAVCVVGFVGGMVFLVANMDDGSGRDGWDDGAQV